MRYTHCSLLAFLIHLNSKLTSWYFTNKSGSVNTSKSNTLHNAGIFLNALLYIIIHTDHLITWSWPPNIMMLTTRWSELDQGVIRIMIIMMLTT